MSRGFIHTSDDMMPSDSLVSPVRRTDLRCSATGVESCRMISPMRVLSANYKGQLLPPDSESSEFGIDSMQVQSPDTCEVSGGWQALPCQMVSSTPVIAQQECNISSRVFHGDRAHEHSDNSISLELEPPKIPTLSPFEPVCKKELQDLQESFFNSSALSNMESGTDARGPLPSWSAFSSKDTLGESQSSGAGNTGGDSSTAFARRLNVQWQAVPEGSQLQDTTMVRQLLADRRLGDFDSAYDWAIQPGSISAVTTEMATDDAMTSLRASEAGMESQAGTTNMDSASGEQDKPGSALDTLMSSEGPSSLSQEGLLEHLRDEGTPRPVDTGSQALCVDNPLANMDSSTLTSALTSARSSAPDPRKDLERQDHSDDDDCFRTHCNPLCNEDSPRRAVPSNPPSCICSGGLQSGAVIPPVLTPPQITRSPKSEPRRCVSSAVNAETQTSLSKSTSTHPMAPPAVVSQQGLCRSTDRVAANGKNVGTATGPRDRPRTTSCHVLHASTTSLPPLSENCATMFESCLEPDSMQSSIDLSGSSCSLLIPDPQRHQQGQDGMHSEMTQDGTTCLLSGMLSRGDSSTMKPSALYGGLHPPASLGSSAPLSVSLPARPRPCEGGLSETLTLEKESSVPSEISSVPTNKAYASTAYAHNNTRHVFDSLRSRVAASCTPDEGNSTEMNLVVPKLNLCLVGLSPLAPEELPPTAIPMGNDGIGATMKGCCNKYADVSEQFACGPISSTYTESPSGDGQPLAGPNTDRSVSGSVVDSFQTLVSDGKGSSGGMSQEAAGNSGVNVCPSSMHSHSTASSCSAPSFKYFSSSTRDDFSHTASQLTRNNSSVCADDSATSPTFRVLSNGADSPKAFGSFANGGERSRPVHPSTGDVTPESALSRRRPMPLHVKGDAIPACNLTTPKGAATSCMQQHKVSMNSQLETVDELTPSPLPPALAARFGGFGDACHAYTSDWVREPSPDITWTPCRDRKSGWAPVLNYNSPAALEPFGRASTALLPTPSPIAAWNRPAQEAAPRNTSDAQCTPNSVANSKACSGPAAAGGTPPPGKVRGERPWLWLCLKSPWASPGSDLKEVAVTSDSAEDSADYGTCISPPVEMDDASQLGETSSTLPLLPTDGYSHSLPLQPSSRGDSVLGPLSSSIQLVSQEPASAAGTTVSLSDALLPLPPSESELSEQGPTTPSKSKKSLLRWRSHEFTTASSSLRLSQSAVPPCGRIFGGSNTCTESRTTVLGGSQRVVKPCEPTEGSVGSGSGTVPPAAVVRPLLVPKRRVLNGRPGPVEASYREDVNVLDGVAATGELEEDALIARCTAKSAAPCSPEDCKRQDKRGILGSVSSVLHCLCCMRREPRVSH